jgi:predicted DNA-binding transcriptional regulator AlpA
MKPTTPSRLTARSRYLSAKRVRERYDDISDMTLWRWLRDLRLNFPKPIKIRNRRYWRLDDLVEWERRRAMVRVATQALPDRPIPPHQSPVAKPSEGGTGGCRDHK